MAGCTPSYKRQEITSGSRDAHVNCMLLSGLITSKLFDSDVNYGGSVSLTVAVSLVVVEFVAVFTGANIGTRRVEAGLSAVVGGLVEALVDICQYTSNIDRYKYSQKKIKTHSQKNVNRGTIRNL